MSATFSSTSAWLMINFFAEVKFCSAAYVITSYIRRLSTRYLFAGLPCGGLLCVCVYEKQHPKIGGDSIGSLTILNIDSSPMQSLDDWSFGQSCVMLFHATRPKYVKTSGRH